MIAMPLVAPLSEAKAYGPFGVGVTANGDPGNETLCRLGLIDCAEALDATLSSALTTRVGMSSKPRIFITNTTLSWSLGP